MNNAKFQIGETVIVDSKYAPKWNGITTIVASTDKIMYREYTDKAVAGHKYQTAAQPDMNKWYFEESIKKVTLLNMMIFKVKIGLRKIESFIDRMQK